MRRLSVWFCFRFCKICCASLALRAPVPFGINGRRLSIARASSFSAFGLHHWSVASTSWFLPVRAAKSPNLNYDTVSEVRWGIFHSFGVYYLHQIHQNSPKFINFFDSLWRFTLFTKKRHSPSPNWFTASICRQIVGVCLRRHHPALCCVVTAKMWITNKNTSWLIGC